MRDKIILTGFMATGKSTVARLIARRLGCRFVDSDRELCARAGKSVAAIFADHGEPHFRAMEREVIAALAADPNRSVIATGGGALVDDRNFAVLSSAGIVICLSARVEVIATRVTRSAHPRPKLLQSGRPLERSIADLMAARAGAYAKAEVTIDTSDLSVEEVADRVIQAATARTANRCEPCGESSLTTPIR